MCSYTSARIATPPRREAHFKGEGMQLHYWLEKYNLMLYVCRDDRDEVDIMAKYFYALQWNVEAY